MRVVESVPRLTLALRQARLILSAPKALSKERRAAQDEGETRAAVR
jgi:hypothetical protein